MPELPTVRKVIAFATGSPSRRYNLAPRTPTCRYNTTPVVQLAVALVIRDFFTQHQGGADPILCYAQEPLFTDTDKQVLQEQGMTVLEDPHGFLEMDAETAIISHHPNVPVRSITADLAKPAMMVWSKVVDRDELPTMMRIEDEDEYMEEDEHEPRYYQL